MLLPGQSLRVRLPLLSPAFRHSKLRRQVPPRPHDARDPSSEGWNYGREYCPVNLAEMTTSTPFWDLLHAVKNNMGPTALLPLRRKACWGFFRRVWTRELGYQRPVRLPLDHRSRSHFIQHVKFTVWKTACILGIMFVFLNFRSSGKVAYNLLLYF